MGFFYLGGYSAGESPEPESGLDGAISRYLSRGQGDDEGPKMGPQVTSQRPDTPGGLGGVMQRSETEEKSYAHYDRPDRRVGCSR